MTHSAAHRYLKSSSDLSYQDDLPFAPSWWQRQSIRFKTTVLAIALGTIPTLAVGSIAYYFAASSIEQQSTDLRKSLVADLQNQVNVFMGDRFNDIQMMAKNLLPSRRFKMLTVSITVLLYLMLKET